MSLIIFTSPRKDSPCDCPECRASHSREGHVWRINHCVSCKKQWADDKAAVVCPECDALAKHVSRKMQEDGTPNGSLPRVCDRLTKACEKPVTGMVHTPAMAGRTITKRPKIIHAR